MRTFCLFFVFLISLSLYGSSLYAQQETLDSLRKIIREKHSDKEKTDAYVLLSGKLSTVSFNETLKIAEQGLELAHQQKDSFAIAELNRNMGIAFYFKGDHEKAAALFYYAAGIYERHQKTRELAVVLNDIAKIYRKTRDLKRARNIYERSLTLFRQLKDSAGIQMILNESGVVYEYLGDYKEALARYNASLQLASLRKDEMGKSWCYNFIAGVFVLQQKYTQAEEFNIRALGIRQKLKDSFAIAVSYSDLGILYSSWGKYERARYYFEQSNFMAEKMQYKELVSNNYAELSKVANMTGDFKTALDYYTWHTQLKDSIFNAQKNRQIEEISTIYETQKREQRIQEQQNEIRKRNRLLFSSLLLVFVILLLTYLIYNRYTLKQKVAYQKEILRQQELASKTILESEEKERTRIAKELHDGIGQKMSAARMNLSSLANNQDTQPKEQQQALSNIIQLVDESCKELRAVSHSMMPLDLLNKGLPQAVNAFLSKIEPSVLKTTFHFEGFEKRLDSNRETILYRILQECVNNTLKHAAASQLDIALIQDTDGISITIEDNGKGFLPEQYQDQNEGIGLQNIRSRVHFLKGTIEFDSGPGKGTLVAIHIPVTT
jgi:signal transduction histidine kinase